MNKKILLIAVLLILAGIAALILNPYITVYRFQSAIKDRDADKINDYIDHAALRQSLKDQFNAMIMKKRIKDAAGDPFTALGVGMASMFAEKMVDSMFPPAGISMMIGKQTDATQKGNGEQQTIKDENSQNFLRRASFDYQSLSRFVVKIKSEKNEKDEVKLIFARDGISWKLSSVELPTSPFDSARESACIDTCRAELKNLNKTTNYNPVEICIQQCKKYNGDCPASDGSGGPYLGCVVCGSMAGQNCESLIKQR